MKRKIYTVIFLLSSYISFSQTPEDALRLSWFQLRGTARNQAIGGAMASLGGDATANHINPAGLAFFKTSDFILTPGYNLEKVKVFSEEQIVQEQVKLSLDLEHPVLYLVALDARHKILLQ